MSNFNLKRDTWTVIKKYLDSNILIDHQLSSFNYFIKNIIPKVVKQYNPIPLSFICNEDDGYNYSLFINFDNSYLGKSIIHENNGCTKLMRPNDARLRNFTYSSPLYIDVIVTTVKKNKKTNEVTKKIEVIPNNQKKKY